MTPEQRAAFQEMQKARAGDPDVFYDTFPTVSSTLVQGPDLPPR
jgi:hypothetical protein